MSKLEIIKPKLFEIFKKKEVLILQLSQLSKVYAIKTFIEKYPETAPELVLGCYLILVNSFR